MNNLLESNNCIKLNTKFALFMNVNDRFLNCFLIEKNVTKDQSSNSFGKEILKNIKQIHHAIILLFCKLLKSLLPQPKSYRQEVWQESLWDVKILDSVLFCFLIYPLPCPG